VARVEVNHINGVSDRTLTSMLPEFQPRSLK
jgi:hypothetical protein